MVYQKSQIGWFLIGLFSAVSVFLVLAYWYQWGTNPLPKIPFLMALAIQIVVLLLFYQLTITVNPSGIRIRYGIGLINISISMEKLLQVDAIKTPWYYGLGIRITPQGLLYNIQGSKAVRLVYQNKSKKKTVMLGTTEPEVLKRVLEKNFNSKAET